VDRQVVKTCPAQAAAETTLVQAAVVVIVVVVVVAAAGEGDSYGYGTRIIKYKSNGEKKYAFKNK
jgi:hypothetical protein